MNGQVHRNEINWVLLKYIKSISGSHSPCKSSMSGRVPGESRIYVCPVCATFRSVSAGSKRGHWTDQWTVWSRMTELIWWVLLCCDVFSLWVSWMTIILSWFWLYPTTKNSPSFTDIVLCISEVPGSQERIESHCVKGCKYMHNNKSNFIPCNIRRKIVPNTITLDTEWPPKWNNFVHSEGFTLLLQLITLHFQ